MLEASQFLRRLAAAPALRRRSSSDEMQPGPGRAVRGGTRSTTSRQRASTVFHPVGTCRMGPDPQDNVVNSELMVHGLHGLRVDRCVDLSGDHVGQHQRADHHGGREGRRPDTARCEAVMSTTVHRTDFRTTPYWWDHVPRPKLPDTPLPRKVDVAVIGSGYTGLQRGAADRARRPRHAGARRRGGGLGLQHAQRRTDLDQHQARLRRARAAARAGARLRHPPGRAQLARLDRGFRRGRADRLRFPRRRPLSRRAQSGAVRGAGARRSQASRRDSKVEAHVVPRAEQRAELGTDAYFGGVVYTRHASVDPGRFHQGMLDARARPAPPSCRVALPRHSARGRGVPRRNRARTWSRRATS